MDTRLRKALGMTCLVKDDHVVAHVEPERPARRRDLGSVLDVARPVERAQTLALGNRDEVLDVGHRAAAVGLVHVRMRHGARLGRPLSPLQLVVRPAALGGHQRLAASHLVDPVLLGGLRVEGKKEEAGRGDGEASCAHLLPRANHADDRSVRGHPQLLDDLLEL
eukprot:scaffold3273_cov126-Isochrysis_galbana.AAC.8